LSIERSLFKTGESRPIIHWSDFDWPDHGAPRSPEPFLQLLSDVRHCGAFDSRYGPPILHCSAGKIRFRFISTSMSSI
jgi:protein tyrosine phosphatase